MASALVLERSKLAGNVSLSYIGTSGTDDQINCCRGSSYRNFSLETGGDSRCRADCHQIECCSPRSMVSPNRLKNIRKPRMNNVSFLECLMNFSEPLNNSINLIEKKKKNHDRILMTTEEPPT